MDSCANRKPIKNSSKNNHDDEQEHRTTRLEDIPNDISLSILSRLPITSLIQFRYASRYCSMLSHDSNLVKPHFVHSLNRHSQNPSFILQSHADVNNLYHAEFSGRDGVKVRRIININLGNVVASCNGLLCLTQDELEKSDLIYIYNPFTKRCQELPRTSSVVFGDVKVWGFGYHQEINEYKVLKSVVRFCEDEGKVEFWLYSSKSGIWKKLPRSYIHPLRRAPVERKASDALVNGRLHWYVDRLEVHGIVFSGQKRIVSFDLMDDTFRKVPTISLLNNKAIYCHLTVLGGSLSSVSLYSTGDLEIWVMEQYGVGESWAKKFDICVKNIQEFGRVLCLSEDGNILVQYHHPCRSLVSHDPKSSKTKALVSEWIPRSYVAFQHVGSLNWIDTPAHAC